MNWDDLKFFLAVAKAHNITDAGHALKASASTVARKVAALEQALGQGLFVKNTTGYFLSEAGQALLPLALETEARFLQMQRQVAHPGSGLEGSVRIECPELMGTHLIIPGLLGFRERYPQIRFDLVNAARSSKLAHSQSDVILRLRRAESGPFTQRRVGRLAQGLFCSDAYAALQGLPGSAADLPAHSLIGWSEDMAHMPLARWLAQISDGQGLWLRVPTLNAQLQAVQAGLGIAALPAYVGHRLGLCPVLPMLTAPGAEIWLLRNQASQGLVRVDRVVEHLDQWLQQHAAELQ